MPKPLTLISTVGTSLFGNLERPDAPSDLREAMTQQNWSLLARLLRQRDSDDRLCGAEINSISSLRHRQLIADPPACLHFCVSETPKGEQTGAVLKSYFGTEQTRTEFHTIESLRDDNPELFRTHRLRNLVRKIGEIVRNAGGSQFVAINATGGYKAQIAIAVLVGQTLGIDVYYKHEFFQTIVAFAPMPISFDWDLLGEHADLLDALEHDQIVQLPESEMPARLRPLLEETTDSDGHRLWSLAPIGQVYLEGFRQRFPAAETLPPPASTDMHRRPTFRDDHYPKGFREFVDQVWNETPYVTGCHSLPYDRQASIRDRRFFVRTDGQCVGEFRDATGFGGRFGIDTTATTAPQRTAVACDLNAWFGRGQ